MKQRFWAFQRRLDLVCYCKIKDRICSKHIPSSKKPSLLLKNNRVDSYIKVLTTSELQIWNEERKLNKNLWILDKTKQIWRSNFFHQQSNKTRNFLFHKFYLSFYFTVESTRKISVQHPEFCGHRDLKNLSNRGEIPLLRRRNKLAADAILYFAVGNKIKASLESPEPLLHVCVKNSARESHLPFQPERTFFPLQ